MKKSLLLITLLIILMIIPFSSLNAAGTCSLIIKAKVTPYTSWVYVYVNGRYKGRLNANKRLNATVPRGKRVTIMIYKSTKKYSYRKTQSVTIGKNLRRKYLTMYVRGKRKVVKRGGRLKIKLSRRSKVSWAYLYINGKYKGIVYRTRYKTVYIKGRRRYHTVRVKRKYRGETYVARRRRVRVRPGRSRYVILRPRIQDDY